MSSGRHRFPQLFRHGRHLLPAAGLLLLCSLLRWALEAPEQESPGLALAILAALPWSLMLTVMDVSVGYGDRAAWLVVAGIALNIWLLWTIAAWFWDLRRDAEDDLH